jgi:signal transduction histidine kinase
MSAMLHDKLSAAARLIERQKVIVARCKALGQGEALAASLLAEMEESERLMRAPGEPPGADRKCAPTSIATRALEPAFLTALARDFKNQLQAIRLDLFSARHSTDRSVLHDIEGGVSMMNLLSHDLFIASTLQDSRLDPDVRPHPVARLLDEVANVAAPIAHLSAVQLRVGPTPGALQVRCDWDQMLHATVGLVLEVVQATRPGGIVSISARRSGDAVRIALTTDTARSSLRPADNFRVWLATTLVQAQGGHVSTGKAIGRDDHIYIMNP